MSGSDIILVLFFNLPTDPTSSYVMSVEQEINLAWPSCSISNASVVVYNCTYSFSYSDMESVASSDKQVSATTSDLLIHLSYLCFCYTGVW